MLLKHLLLGLGGSAAVGGIGYGIYSSSQVSEKENAVDVGNLENSSSPEESDLKSPSGDQGGEKEKIEEQQKEDAEEQAGGTNATSNPANISQTTPEGTPPQFGGSPASSEPTGK